MHFDTGRALRVSLFAFALIVVHSARTQEGLRMDTFEAGVIAGVVLFVIFGYIASVITVSVNLARLCWSKLSGKPYRRRRTY